MSLAALASILPIIAGAARGAMTLTSADIAPNSTIHAPQIYPRCGGANISPELSWTRPPNRARSLVLTMIDLDAKPARWSHWIVVDLPPSATGLPRGVKVLPGKAHAVAGNFGDAAYDGPCPSSGTGVHRYQFTIWAMPAATTTIVPDSKASEIAPALAKTALARGSLTGTVRR